MYLSIYLSIYAYIHIHASTIAITITITITILAWSSSNLQTQLLTNYICNSLLYSTSASSITLNAASQLCMATPGCWAITVSSFGSVFTTAYTSTTSDTYISLCTGTPLTALTVTTNAAILYNPIIPQTSAGN
jgi:hypothetical protein